MYKAENKDQTDILSEYQDVFTGVGCVPGLPHIQLNPDAAPVLRLNFVFREILENLKKAMYAVLSYPIRKLLFSQLLFLCFQVRNDGMARQSKPGIRVHSQDRIQDHSSNFSDTHKREK